MTVIKAARIFDGRSDALLRNSSVVEAKKIAGLGNSARVLQVARWLTWVMWPVAGLRWRAYSPQLGCHRLYQVVRESVSAANLRACLPRSSQCHEKRCMQSSLPCAM